MMIKTKSLEISPIQKKFSVELTKVHSAFESEGFSDIQKGQRLARHEFKWDGVRETTG